MQAHRTLDARGGHCRLDNFLILTPKAEILPAPREQFPSFEIRKTIIQPQNLGRGGEQK
jgi:hypothetical protein